MGDQTCKIEALDHLVLTVGDVPQTVAFYTRVFGMEAIEFHPTDGSARWALSFGAQKINLHQAGAEFEPKARVATPGSADLCFLSTTPVAAWAAHLSNCGVEVEVGPVARTGATGAIVSIYLRDPDGNLIEMSNRA